jgi:hypothetical protein
MERGLSDGDLQTLAEIAGRLRVSGNDIRAISRRLARDGAPPFNLTGQHACEIAQWNAPRG